MKKIEQLQKELNKAGFLIKRASELHKEPKLRTGVFAFDFVIDGGISLSEGGHRIELFGAESSGKTTFALYIIKKFQEQGKLCAFIDAEKSYDKDWGEQLGIKNEDLLIIYPETLEQAGDLFMEIIPKVDLVVIDSVTSLIPIGEAERETEKVQMALSARVNSLITRKIYSALGDKLVTMIFINQLREKVGVMYGNPYTTPGGHALKHMYNTRVQFRAGKPIEVEKERVGIEIFLNCVKNKKGKPFRKTSVDFYLNGHIDNNKSLFFAGLQFNIIERAGNTYKFGEKEGVGKDNFIATLTDKDWKKIEIEIWKRLK